MKVSIIGGGGGSAATRPSPSSATGIVSEIHLLDANEKTAQGEALDLLHGASIAGDQRIYAGNYDRCGDADVVCITAGLRRKPDESRLDLINRNVSLFKQILESLKGAGLRKDAILFVVSNPVDVLTRLALDFLKWDPAKVIGLGTVLDTTRFRSLIAQETQLPATQVKALILGEHGDSMVPIWSTAEAGGIPLVKLPNFNGTVQTKLFERTKKSGAEAISLKGGAGGRWP
jgi:L-lactate dehydrogenase